MSFARKQLYYYWKKMSERQTRKKLATRFFKGDLERYHACTVQKPQAQQQQERKALQKYWNCYPFQYYRFDLYRQDCTLSLEEMKKYVPLFFLNNLFFPPSFKDYGIVCEDKWLTCALFKAYEIPQPALLFGFDHDAFFDAENSLLHDTDVDKLIGASRAERLFVKARFGSEGKGIFIFTKDVDGFFKDADNVRLSVNFFKIDPRLKAIQGRDVTGFFLVQEGLVPHEDLKKIYSGAVNTFRINTECVDGDVRILHTLLRMGSGGEQVDNATVGGMYVKIDQETGALADAAYMTNRSLHAQHPDTGFIFNGAVLANWPELLAFAKNLAQKFREIRYLGWDIAHTTDGFSVIEMNHHPGFGIVQDCYGGARDDLKINPTDWWYRSNYTVKNT